MRNVVEHVKRHGKRIVSWFGWRSGGKSGNTTYKTGMHRGVDIGGYAWGESFLSPFDGVITAVRTSGMGTWGNTVCMLIDDTDGKRTMLTAHHKNIHVKVGDRIKKDDPIAVVGGTTHNGVTYDEHVHLEIQKTHTDPRYPWRGEPIDPATFWVEQTPEAPSDRFAAGDKIFNWTNARINVRKGPGTMTNLIGDQVAPGQEVTIQSVPGNGVRAGGHHWWKIENGWIAEDFFDLVVESDPAPIKPPEEDEENIPIEPEPFEGLTEMLRNLMEKIQGILERIGAN